MSKLQTMGPGFATTVSQLTYRNLGGLASDPSVLLMSVIQSVVFLLIFTLAFRNAVTVDRSDYVTYVVPGILVVSVLFASMHVATKVASDRQSGFMDRVRAMPISRPGIPASYIATGLLVVMTTLAVLVPVAVIVGFTPRLSIISMLGAAAMVTSFALAIVTMFTALGFVAPSVDAAQGISFLVMPVSFLSDAFVPAESMVEWLQPIAANQPVSTVIQATRQLLVVGAVDHSLAWRATGWIAVLLTIGLVVSCKAAARRG